MTNISIPQLVEMVGKDGLPKDISLLIQSKPGCGVRAQFIQSAKDNDVNFIPIELNHTTTFSFGSEMPRIASDTINLIKEAGDSGKPTIVFVDDSVSSSSDYTSFNHFLLEMISARILCYTNDKLEAKALKLDDNIKIAISTHSNTQTLWPPILARCVHINLPDVE